MRIPDFVTRSVVFVAEEIPGGDPSLEGTAFTVAVWSEIRNGGPYFYLVTAKHIVQDLDARQILFIANSKSGGVITMAKPADQPWVSHPTDKTADLLVLPIDLLIPSGIDLLPLGLDRFCTPEVMAKHSIGIGDEVFLPGLFTHAPGAKRNCPIVRQGNIAMLPEEQVQVVNSGRSEFMDAYLIEARSIAGISGAPVFVRETVSMKGIGLGGDERYLHGPSDFHLLGLMHGHWDIDESEINHPRPTHKGKGSGGINSGIAIVVPAEKILETLYHPELVRLRREGDAELLSGIAPTKD